MEDAGSFQGSIRFGVFEVDAQARELLRKGSRIKLQQQPFELLLILLQNAGKVVSREELRQRLWPADVYVDFDRSLNKAVVKLREALGDSADSPRYIETLPRLGYRFIGAVENGHAAETTAAKLPPSEVARIGNLPEPGVGNPEAPEKVWRKSWWRYAMIAAVAVAGTLFAAWAGRGHKGEAAIHSLAVLPLSNLSGDEGQEYFADGMTDELTTMLAKNSTLRIVSRTSVMQYKGAKQPLPDIARALGVDSVLEGSVSRSGNKVHMTLQLIRASNDTHIWADSYERNTADVVNLPREAAQTIASRLNSAVDQPEVARYVNPQAHDDYLHGRYLWLRGINEEAGKYFKHAVTLQPDYALGWAGLSMYYSQGAGMDLEPREAAGPALEAGRKAVQLDDQLPQAHLVLGAAIFVLQWNWDESMREVNRAIELDPRFSEAHHFRGKMNVLLNHPAEAIEGQKIADELSPYERPWAMAKMLYELRRYDEALVEVRKQERIDPDSIRDIAENVYRVKGMFPESVEEYAKILEMMGDPVDAKGARQAFARSGYRGYLQWRIDLTKAWEKQGHYVSPLELAHLKGQLGEKQETLALLEEGLERKDPTILEIQTEPAYDFLHGEKRYRAIVKSVGLPALY